MNPNLQHVINQLKQQQVVAYPTESVFGLGCLPLSESAVQKLLSLKQRPIEKGLIVIAPSLDYLLPFIHQDKLDERQWQRLTTPLDRPTTWIVPANPTVPAYLTGKFNSIAIRLCDHIAVKQICENLNSAITSTSANLTGQAPAKTAEQVYQQFGKDFPVLEQQIGNAQNPSQILDIFTQQIIRQG